MRLRWTRRALLDLQRLYAFLEEVNEPAAARAAQALVRAAGFLPEQPRIGRRLEQFRDREVRRTLVGQYELRYEIRDEVIILLRIWHTREQR